VAHLLEHVEAELVELRTTRRRGLLEPQVEAEGAIVIVTRHRLKLGQKVAIEKQLRHDAPSHHNAVAVGNEITQTLLNPCLCLVRRAINIETVGKWRSHNDAAASIGQVVDELGAVEAAGKEMRFVGVDSASGPGTHA